MSCRRMSTSWSDLVRMSKGEEVHVARHPHVQREYEERKALVRSMFANYSDVIKIECLGFVASKVRPYTAVPTDNTLTTSLTSTPYPIALDEGIAQNILWSLEELSAQDIERVVERQYVPHLFEYVYYENKPEDKSIPDLWHVHVFVRPRPRQA